jgi:alkylhydroperoxidase/carboxymuconolactone decarboxylase family protein YurZ
MKEVATPTTVTKGPWDAAPLTQVREWDPDWADACVKMSDNPWTSGVLSRKLVELISLGLNVACTNLNSDGTRRHTRAALKAGATRDEVLFVVKACALMAIHALATGAPILAEEAKAAGVKPVPPSNAVATPACDAMKAIGQWNAVWDPLVALDPVWFDEFMATAAGVYKTCPLPPKELELLSIACDASYTHMYAPGTRRHIKRAFEAGATMEEIVEVLKLCVVQGVQACNLGVPILSEELAKRGKGNPET